jgi:hypothetical protein
MKALTCAATRRRLHAFHDDELQVGDQIGVAAHLEWCDDCARTFADLRLLRAALRAAAPRDFVLSDDESASLQTTVVNRIRAERTVSFSADVRNLFNDMHFVYVGLCAAVATAICVVSVLTMVRFGAVARPDSLASLVDVFGSPGSPGSNENPMPGYARVLVPGAINEAFPTTTGINSNDFVFMLAAVVTREGTVSNLELLHGASGRPVAPGTDEARAAKNLIGAVSRTRFEPARVDGLPVAVNMVWLVANTTVRASDTARPPVTRKRVTSRMPHSSGVLTAV